MFIELLLLLGSYNRADQESIQPDGSLSAPAKLQYDGHGANPDRQEKPHLHAINFTPDQKYLLVACRDSNSIEIYERDATTGLLKATGRSITMPRPMFVKLMK